MLWLEPVVGAIHRDESIRVSVTDPEFIFEVRDLFHVFRVAHRIELLHPVLNRLPVLLLDKGKVRGRAAGFFTHSVSVVEAIGHHRMSRDFERMNFHLLVRAH